MKKVLKTFLLSALICTAIIFSMGKSVCADDGKSDDVLEERSGEIAITGEGYRINSLDVKVKVDDDNTYHVTQDIEYDFLTPHHGPVRQFLENHVIHYENSSQAVSAKVKGLRVSSLDAPAWIAKDEYGGSGAETYKKVYIGDKNTTITGIHHYTLSYVYEILSPDEFELNDIFEFDIVGTGWGRNIGKVTWEIELPVDIEESDIIYNVYKQTEPGKGKVLSYTMADKVINGTLQDNIIRGSEEGYAPGDFLRLQIRFPDGYYKKRHLRLVDVTHFLATIFSVKHMATFGVILLIGWSYISGGTSGGKGSGYNSWNSSDYSGGGGGDCGSSDCGGGDGGGAW